MEDVSILNMTEKILNKIIQIIFLLTLLYIFSMMNSWLKLKLREPSIITEYKTIYQEVEKECVCTLSDIPALPSDN